MSKPLEQQFADWENDFFGFGYGTGEPHIIASMKAFFASVPDDGSYDHERLEETCGATVAWLFINMLCRDNYIEYGTSPRYGWLTATGRELRRYFLDTPLDDLVHQAAGRPDDCIPCYPDYCNCDDCEVHPCNNVFWGRPAGY